MSHKRPRRLNGRRQKCKIWTVGERDGWVCWICEFPVSLGADSDDPERASLDHVVPLAGGGANANDNLRIAHACCNELRAQNLRSFGLAA